jgi:hypothetical protein
MLKYIFLILLTQKVLDLITNLEQMTLKRAVKDKNKIMKK